MIYCCLDRRNVKRIIHQVSAVSGRKVAPAQEDPSFPFPQVSSPFLLTRAMQSLFHSPAYTS